MIAQTIVSASAEAEAETAFSDETLSAEVDGAHQLQRITWLGVVGVLVFTELVPDWLALHSGATPLAAGIVFGISGVMRRARGFPMRLSSWVACVLLLATAALGYISRPDWDLSLVVVVCAACVITLELFSRDR